MEELKDPTNTVIRLRDRNRRFAEEEPEEIEAPKNFPVLLNHEKIFLFITGICFLIAFILVQRNMSLLKAWYLYLTIATVLNILANILDNLVLQITAIYKDTLENKINNNHLIKMLKLSKFRDSSVNYILAVLYAAFVYFILVFYLREIKFAHLFLVFGEMFLDIEWLQELDPDLLLFVFAPISVLTAVVLLVLFGLLARKVLPKSARNTVYYPFRQFFSLIAGLHEMFKSIFKIFFLIIFTAKEFLTSCFYLIVSGMMALGKKHYLSTIEVDYLLYVKTLLVILGAVGYFYCFTKAYS